MRAPKDWNEEYRRLESAFEAFKKKAIKATKKELAKKQIGLKPSTLSALVERGDDVYSDNDGRNQAKSPSLRTSNEGKRESRNEDYEPQQHQQSNLMTGDLPVINSYNSEYEGEFSPSSPNKQVSSADSRNVIQHEIIKAKSHKTDEMLEQSCDYYPNQHHINIDFKNQISKKRSS